MTATNKKIKQRVRNEQQIMSDNAYFCDLCVKNDLFSDTIKANNSASTFADSLMILAYDNGRFFPWSHVKNFSDKVFDGEIVIEEPIVYKFEAWECISTDGVEFKRRHVYPVILGRGGIPYVQLIKDDGNWSAKELVYKESSSGEEMLSTKDGLSSFVRHVRSISCHEVRTFIENNKMQLKMNIETEAQV